VDRNLTRFAKSTAGQMRDHFPDRLPAVLLEVLADGRGVVQFDTGAVCTIDFPPAGAASIGVGTRGYVRFTKGNQQRAWWRTHSRGDFSDAGAPPPIALTANWRCAHGDFQRRNSYTSATFAFADLEAKTSLATQASVGLGGSMPRFYEGFAAWICPDYRIIEPEDEDYDEGIGGGDPYQFGPHLLRIIPAYPEFVWAHNLASDLPEGLVTDWLTFAANNLAILDDGEIVLGWEHTFEGTTTDFLTIFPNDDTVVHRKTCVDMGHRRRSGADTVQVGDYLCTPVYDPDTFEEKIHFWEIPGTATTGAVLDLTGADSPGSIGVVWPTPQDTLPESWVGANRLIVQDGSGGLYAIDPTGPTIDWTYAGTKPLRALVVNGSTLICAYENYATTTVTDVFDSATWDGTGGTTEDREILAEGLSTTGGLLYLSCTTGNEISTFAFAGEEAYGYELGPKTETRTSHTGPSYTSPEWKDPEDDYWLSGWSSNLIAMRDAVLVGGTDPEEPGAEETYPYATASWANDLFESIYHYGIAPVGGTGPGEAWIDEVVVLFNEMREALVRQAFEIIAARPGPSYYIKRELYRNTWHSYSRTEATYDDLHTRIAFTTYTEPPTGSGAPDALQRAIPTDYEGTEEAASIADTELVDDFGDFTSGGWWITGNGARTYSWELVKVWSNVQEEIPLLKTPEPIHATGPATVGLGLIVIGPAATTDLGNDAHWVARPLSNPSTTAWTFSVVSGSSDILTGNTWMDAGRVWIEYNDDGTNWKLVGLDPETGLPDEADPDITIDSGNVVFDGTNLHGENCEWAIGPA
jgi:hypothetical protein